MLTAAKSLLRRQTGVPFAHSGRSGTCNAVSTGSETSFRTIHMILTRNSGSRESMVHRCVLLRRRASG